MLIIKCVYREVNNAINWIAYYIADHFGEVLWIQIGYILKSLSDLLFSNFVVVLILDLYKRSISTPFPLFPSRKEKRKKKK